MNSKVTKCLVLMALSRGLGWIGDFAFRGSCEIESLYFVVGDTFVGFGPSRGTRLPPTKPKLPQPHRSTSVLQQFQGLVSLALWRATTNADVVRVCKLLGNRQWSVELRRLFRLPAE